MIIPILLLSAVQASLHFGSCSSKPDCKLPEESNLTSAEHVDINGPWIVTERDSFSPGSGDSKLCPAVNLAQSYDMGIVLSEINAPGYWLLQWFQDEFKEASGKHFLATDGEYAAIEVCNDHFLGAFHSSEILLVSRSGRIDQEKLSTVKSALFYHCHFPIESRMQVQNSQCTPSFMVEMCLATERASGDEGDYYHRVLGFIIIGPKVRILGRQETYCRKLLFRHFGFFILTHNNTSVEITHCKHVPMDQPHCDVPLEMLRAAPFKLEAQPIIAHTGQYPDTKSTGPMFLTAPTKVTELRGSYNLSRKAFTLSWEKPAYEGLSSLKEYVVSISDGRNFMTPASAPHLEIPMNETGQLYNITIRAVNSHGQGLADTREVRASSTSAGISQPVFTHDIYTIVQKLEWTVPLREEPVVLDSFTFMNPKSGATSTYKVSSNYTSSYSSFTEQEFKMLTKKLKADDLELSIAIRFKMTRSGKLFHSSPFTSFVYTIPLHTEFASFTGTFSKIKLKCRSERIKAFTYELEQQISHPERSRSDLVWKVVKTSSDGVFEIDNSSTMQKKFYWYCSSSNTAGGSYHSSSLLIQKIKPGFPYFVEDISYTKMDPAIAGQEKGLLSWKLSDTSQISKLLFTVKVIDSNTHLQTIHDYEPVVRTGKSEVEISWDYGFAQIEANLYDEDEELASTTNLNVDRD